MIFHSRVTPSTYRGEILNQDLQDVWRKAHCVTRRPHFQGVYIHGMQFLENEDVLPVISPKKLKTIYIYIHIYIYTLMFHLSIEPFKLGIYIHNYGILKADGRQSRWWPFFKYFSSPRIKSGWWFQIFFIFTPIWGRFPFWRIFFKWVVQPPTRNWEIIQIWLEHIFQLGGEKSNHQLAVGSPRLTRWRLCLGSEPKGWEIHGVSGPRRAAFVYRLSFIFLHVLMFFLFKIF